MFKKVLVANRGVVALRIFRTLRKLGVSSVGVYSDADLHAAHVSHADEAIHIGPAPAKQSYLRGDAIIRAALDTGACAIHPGYGFLSENADFAAACDDAGLVFIGPRVDHIRQFGSKHSARLLALNAGVPVVPGSGLISDAIEGLLEANRIGYPVMLKSTGGGGGIGLQRVDSDVDFQEQFQRVSRLAQANFKDTGVFVEKFIGRGRHIEVQLFGDGRGRVLALGERDCSVQRRNQKIVEETPAPGIQPELRMKLLHTAERLAAAVQYQSAGTVEFLYDIETSQFYFLEMNTRLQVEHGITEEVLDIDLVEWMVRQAAGEPVLDLAPSLQPKGASIEARVYAEDPARGFRPSAGRVIDAVWPADARLETCIAAGLDVPPHYDPLIAKIIVHAPTRQEAVTKLRMALEETSLAGIETNLDLLRQIAEAEPFARGEMTTTSLPTLKLVSTTIEVLSPGVQTTIQDWPGRLGYWAVGVPPSGPMDDRSFRLANRIVGNPEGAPALEIMLAGPSLRFFHEAVICLAGAQFEASVDGAAVPFWTPICVKPGQTLSIGATLGPGARAYLAIRGGLKVPSYLGSSSTFLLGKFGGHAGRALAVGDILAFVPHATDCSGSALPAELVPVMDNHWHLGVLYGPHGASDYFTDDDIAAFFSAEWSVHYNSDRTGIRLIGPKPKWARADGGEAGLHPSNIHDNAYAIGSINYTGDMPVMLGPDGPSLGGFVCPATVVHGDLWKIGQLKAGDKVTFERVSAAEAAARDAKLRHEIRTLSVYRKPRTPDGPVLDDCILWRRTELNNKPAIVCRRAGDRNILIEYGQNNLDIRLRMYVHVLAERLADLKLEGILDLTPGVRSLQVHYDDRIELQVLLATIASLDGDIGHIEDIEVPSRVIHLPLSWSDPAVQQTIDRYVQSVRADAPWCPSNIEFIRRMNGLDDTADVKRIVLDATYLVIGLGDVYLGAPLAVPLDPRHRLVTTKYNPARTWTPENVVGIGGAYLCVYGMEGPGGYQLFGRTCQMWNTYFTTSEFQPGVPWLLRPFDQIKFYLVDDKELADFRENFPQGRRSLDIEHTTFRMSDYMEFISRHAESINAFKHRQQTAFEAERARWQQVIVPEPAPLPQATASIESKIPDGHVGLFSPVAGIIWKADVNSGDTVSHAQVLFIIECMKTEIPVLAPCNGTVTRVACGVGDAISAGQSLAVLRP